MVKKVLLREYSLPLGGLLAVLTFVAAFTGGLAKGVYSIRQHDLAQINARIEKETNDRKESMAEIQKRIAQMEERLIEQMNRSEERMTERFSRLEGRLMGP